MKIARIFLFLILVLFGSVSAKAQSNLLNSNDLSGINIDNYSDDELSGMYYKAAESGLSATQLYQLVAEKGLPKSEIDKLKNRLQRVIKPTGAQQKESADVKENQHDTANSKIPLRKFEYDHSIFGSELFATSSMIFEPNLRIPAPAGYILGPSDEIIISVYGYSEKKYSLKINEHGEIYIPNVGPLFINGLTLEEAEKKIKAKLASTIYRAINSGQTSIQVSLGKIRSIRVMVIGQAKMPGAYTVSSLTSLYNILYLCGGPTDMGSYRNIEVIRGNEIKRTADLYDFLANGIREDNIILQNGDVIRIPYYKIRATLSGNVKREGKFEMDENETFKDLLGYAGGFKDNAYRGGVSVTRLTDTGKKMIDLEMPAYNTFKVNGSDWYFVRKIQDAFENRVEISGAVLRPGPYQLTQKMSVRGLIEKAGGLAVDAYTKRISIFRNSKNKAPSVLSINLDALSAGNLPVYLHKDDSIAVHSIFEFKDKNQVSIEGNVRNPGKIQWRKNITLRDVLLAVGGITPSGDSSSIEISRRIKDAKIDKVNYNESKVFIINLLKNPSVDIALQPFDLIVVKQLPGYSVQRSILITGEVKSPGKYSLQKTGDKISDVIFRTGGLKASADSTSITIRRQRASNVSVQEREEMYQRILTGGHDSISTNKRLKNELYKGYDLINVDLDKALSKQKSSQNLVLEDGDILIVHRNSNLVKISGEVYFPTIVPYKPNKNLKYYVQQAGNFMPSARKTGALVIHPDGKVASVKHFLWFKFWPSVTPRAEIFVPQKVKSNQAKIGATEWALIVSALGIVANVIFNVTK